MNSDAQIIIEVKSPGDGAKVIRRDLDALSKSGDNATAASKRLEGQMRTTATATQALSRAMGALFVAVGAREIIRMADAVSQVQGRLLNATRSAGEAEQAFNGLRSVVQRTGTDMETVVSVFQRLSFVRDEIGATMGEMLQFTDTVSKLGVVSGASFTAMRAGLTQLGQGLSSNVVRAEEWNSIMENIPAVGKQIADQFGITTGQLRLLVVEGEVLSKDVFAAMINSAAEVEAQFERMPMTISRAFAALRSDMELFIGQTSQASGATSVMIGVVDSLRLAIFGLGQGFSAVVSIIGTAGALIVNAIDTIVNRVLENINGMIDMVNKIPGVGLSKFDVNWNSVSSADIIGAGKDDLQAILNQKPPQNTVFDRIAGNASGSSAPASVREITKDYKELAKTISGDEKGKSVKKAQDELTKAIKASRTEEERLLEEIAKLESQRGLARATGQSAELEEAIRRARGELDKVRIQTERDGPVAKAFESLVGQIDDGFRDAFRNAFTGADNGWKGLIDGMKASFKTLLADLAYMAFQKRIMVSIAGIVGGGMGVSSGAQASILGDIGGTGGGFSLGNLGSVGSRLLNGGLYSNTLGGFGSGVGNLLSGQAWGAMGPSKAAAIGGGAFGNLGYGAIGGFGASLLGLGSQNSIVNMISGGLGSLAGGAVGTSMGTILGMAGGPIGALAGGFLGTALGGLFGSSKPKRGTLGGVIRATDGRLNFASNGRKGSDEFVRAVIDPLNAIMEALGGGFNNSGLGSLETNTVRDKKTVLFHNQVVSRKVADVDAVIRAVLNRNDLFGGADTQLLDVVRRSTRMGSSGSQILSDIELAKQAFGMTESPEIEAAKDALEEINELFKTMTERAMNLGLPMDKLNIAFSEQKAAMEGAVKALQAGFSSFEDMTATFKAFLDRQMLGSSSSLTMKGKLAYAQEGYESLLGKAQGGDLSVTQDLLSSASQVIDLQRGVYGSSKSFADVEAMIMADIREIAKAAGVPGYATGTDYAQSGMAMVGERGRELVQMRGGEKVWNAGETAGIMAASGAAASDIVRTNAMMIAKMDEMIEASREQARQYMMMRKEHTRFAAKAKVTV